MSVVQLSRREAFRALRAGQSAAKAGEPVTTCPYDAAGDVTQRWLARFWLRGWNATTSPQQDDQTPSQP